MYSSRRGKGLWCVALPVAALVVLAGAPSPAQRPYPVYTEYHLDRTMLVVGRNFAGAPAALTDGDFRMAKERLTRRHWEQPDPGGAGRQQRATSA